MTPCPRCQKGEPWHTPPEAAKHLGVHPNQIYIAVKRKLLNVRHFGSRLYRVHIDELNVTKDRREVSTRWAVHQ